MEEYQHMDVSDVLNYCVEGGDIWLELNLNDYGYHKTDPHQYFPTQLSRSENKGWVPFLFEKMVEQYGDLVQGIMLGKEVDMDTSEEKLGKYVFTPLNTDHCHYKDVWCREVVDIKDLRVKEIKDEKERDYLEELRKKLLNQQFMRISSDRDFTYGDGGECRLVKPLYHCKTLGLCKNKRLRLKELLNQLGDQTQDFHETCPVQDIIDPELMPNYSNMISDHNQYKMPIQKVRRRYDNDCQTVETNEYVSLRAQYQWIPTKFRIYKNAKVEIVGEIHNLPRKDNEELYELIKCSFQQMLPGWKELNLIEFNNKKQDYCTLQVVVKAQKYVIQPGQKYSGKWHLEGKTENIVAAGVYYISIDQGFERDKLQYKPLICYDYGYQYNSKTFLREWELDVSECCSVVFSNTLPHRFDTLTNPTDKPLERLFMNFFIVDPAKPIIDTEYVCDLQKVISQKTNNNISKLIMQSMGFEFDIQKGKEKRKQVRENSGKELSGWGFIHYGNSGDVEFIDSFQANNERASRFNIQKQ